MAFNPAMLAGASGGSRLDFALDSGSETGDIFARQNSTFVVGGQSPDFNFNKALPWVIFGVLGLIYLRSK